jgi:hypothetical protein
MAQLIVRRLDDAVKERLRARAKKHGRSLEAEARAILEEAAEGKAGGSALQKKEKGFGERLKRAGLTEEEYAEFQKGIHELNGNGHRARDDELARAAPMPGFGTRASARFKGVGLSRREIETLNRAVDKRRRERPRRVKFDR